MLKFQKSVGEDAESVDMNGSSDLEELWIQVEVVLQPGDAVFDGIGGTILCGGAWQCEQDQPVPGPGRLYGRHCTQAMVLLQGVWHADGATR